ncbi:MAG: hypothetical protein Q7R39_00290 [Dehalococcoidia bacterium]|nr:hypothetical protein [Dehalococcoidia bacterium]
MSKPWNNEELKLALHSCLERPRSATPEAKGMNTCGPTSLPIRLCDDAETAPSASLGRPALNANASEPWQRLLGDLRVAMATIDETGLIASVNGGAKKLPLGAKAMVPGDVYRDVVPRLVARALDEVLAFGASRTIPRCDAGHQVYRVICSPLDLASGVRGALLAWDHALPLV